MAQVLDIPNVPEGKIAVWENGKVVFKDKLDFPESWEDYCKYNNPGNVLLQLDSSISTGDENSKNTITFSVSKEKKEQFIAFIKLVHLRDCYRQGWVPDDSSYCNGEEKYCIWKNYDEKGYVKLVVDPIYSSVRFLTFQTHEIAKKFLCNFRELILEAEDLIF